MRVRREDTRLGPKQALQGRSTWTSATAWLAEGTACVAAAHQSAAIKRLPLIPSQFWARRDAFIFSFA
jgi:hypothetical protein